MSVIDDSIKEAIFTESFEHLDKMDEELLKLESAPNDLDLIKSIFRSVHTIKGSVGLLEEKELLEFLQKFESVLSDLRDGKILPTLEMIEIFNLCRIKIKESLEAIKENKEKKFDFDEIIKELDNILTGKFAKSEIKEERISKVPSGIESFKLKEKSIRIDLEKIDNLIKNIGELWNLNNRKINIFTSVQKIFNELNIGKFIERIKKEGYKEDFSKGVTDLEIIKILESDLKSGISELNEILIQFNYILQELRDRILQTRMVPVNELFVRFPRLISDVSKKTGKKVELKIIGEETEIDRSILDAVSESLIHILRNAVDHGIELPEERKKRGKSETGKITLSAYLKGNNVVIEVLDDGAGIDIEKIKEVAKSKGISIEGMTEKEIINLIFLPGFSTKEEVTEVSGRGVGMDVVYNNITKLKGDIEVESQLGVGTTFRISLPVTLSIVQSFFFEVSNNKFAFMREDIETLLRIKKEELKKIQNKDFVLYNENYVPLYNLSHIFFGKNGKENENFLNLIILQSKGRYYAFSVDKFIGLREIVLINIPQTLLKNKLFNVATIGDDGVIVPVINKIELLEILKM